MQELNVTEKMLVTFCYFEAFDYMYIYNGIQIKIIHDQVEKGLISNDRISTM